MIRCSGYFFFFFTIQAVLTPSLQLFLKAQGYDYLQIGLLQGIFQVVGVFGPLLIGKLADLTAKYRIFIGLCLLGVIPCFLLIDVSPIFWLNCILVGVAGFLSRSTLPLSDALVSHSLVDPQREYGKVRPLGSVGFLLVATLIDLTAFFKTDFTDRFIFLLIVTSGISILMLFLLPAYKKEASTESKIVANEKIDPVFYLILIAIFFGSLGSAGFMSFYTLFLISPEVGVIYPNIHWALGAVFEIPFFFISALLIKRWGIQKVLGISLVAIIVRLGLYGFIHDPSLLLATQVLNGLTFGLFHSVAIASINRYVPATKKALGMALYFSLTKGSALFIGNIIGGFIAQWWGLANLFKIFALFAIPGLIVLLFCKRARKSSFQES